MVGAGDMEQATLLRQQQQHQTQQREQSWRDYVASVLLPNKTASSSQQNHYYNNHNEDPSFLPATSEHSATSYHSIASHSIVVQETPEQSRDPVATTTTTTTTNTNRDVTSLVGTMQSALWAYQLKQAWNSIGASPFQQFQEPFHDDNDIETGGGTGTAVPNNTSTTTVAVKGEESDQAVTAVAMTLCLAVAMTGVIAGGVSFWLVGSQWVDVASVSLMLIAPMVAIQKIKLQALGEMRGQLNLLRANVNQLHEENKKLKDSVDELHTSVESLKSVEADLQDIAQQSGATVDKLVSIVHENGQVQAKIKAALEAQVMQQIMTACLQSDRDQDFTVSKTEVEALILRLKNMPGVQFQELKFRKLLKSDTGELTMADLCRIARNMKGKKSRTGQKQQAGSGARDDAVFVFQPRQLILS